MGGIESGDDALAFLAAGATALAVGTANFRDPLVGNRIREELRLGLRRAGADSLSGVRGRIAASTST
jgi:dihydroorotate dehydrogenase (NAD+) catalytic subunit